MYSEKYLHVYWVCLFPLEPREICPTQPLQSGVAIHLILEETPAPRHDTGLTDLHLCKATAGHFRAPQVSPDAYLWATGVSPRFSLAPVGAWSPALSVGNCMSTLEHRNMVIRE